MSVSIIIPAHNEEERIGATLSSILQQTMLPDKVYVVDDCSTDSTDSAVQDWRNGWKLPFELITLRSNTLLGSKAKAQNFALQYVTTKYVVAVDADTGLERNALKNLVERMESSNATGCSTWVIPKTMNSIWTQGRTIEYLYAFQWFKRVQDKLKRPMTISGCVNIFKTSTLKHIGGYPEDTLAEDMDLTSTIYERGLGSGAFSKDAVAFTDDPTKFIDLKHQLERWSCAYYQNVRKHLQRLLHNDTTAASFLFVSLMDGLWGTMFYPLLVFFALFYSVWMSLAIAAFDALLIVLIVSFPARRFKIFPRVITFLPSYYLLRAVNTYYNFKWAILTGIFNRSLKGYIKGH